ncbi:protein of unknown function [Pseudomonas sp. JV551A1]|nr:protein of unknown function [Pseudomonas sp. JV551A1]
MLYCYPTFIGNCSVTAPAQVRGVRKQFRSVSVHPCSHFLQYGTLHLPSYKALPIIGPGIARSIGSISCAFAYFALAVNIARSGFRRFCK